MRFATLFLIVSGLVRFEAHACSCAPCSADRFEDVARAMTSFEYVAQGTVLRSSAPFDDANGPGQSVQLIIKTGKIWKGKRREWLAVNSSLGCGIQQTPNDGEWFDFVAVRDENGDLYSDLCLNYCAASMGWFDDSRIGWIDGMP